MRVFDEKAVRAGLLATIAAGGFDGKPIRVGQEGGEIRPPMVTVVPPAYSPLALGEGGFVVPSAEWPLFLYVKLDHSTAEDQLADFAVAVLTQLMGDPRLGSTVLGSTVSLARTPEIVELGPGAARPGRKMLRRQCTLQTRHR